MLTVNTSVALMLNVIRLLEAPFTSTISLSGERVDFIFWALRRKKQRSLTSNHRSNFLHANHPIPLRSHELRCMPIDDYCTGNTKVLYPRLCKLKCRSHSHTNRACIAHVGACMHRTYLWRRVCMAIVMGCAVCGWRVRVGIVRVWHWLVCGAVRVVIRVGARWLMHSGNATQAKTCNIYTQLPSLTTL